LYLSSTLIEEITGGEWLNLDDDINFKKVIVWRKEEFEIFFNPKENHFSENIFFMWQKPNHNNNNLIEDLISSGVAAIVVSEKDKNKYQYQRRQTITHPLLVVKNSKKALKDIAFYMRDNFKIPRVVVTGAVGKTGFKNQLIKLLSFQTEVNATCGTRNLDNAILCSMSSLDVNDKVEIIEVAGSEPHVCTRRSNLVKPNMCVITKLGIQHMNWHGSINNMIYNKASIVDGLQQGGICILNADCEYFERIKKIIKEKRDDIIIKTFGSNEDCDARLIKSKLNMCDLIWNVEASIEGIEVSYKVPILGEHVPVMSLCPLLSVNCLGYDVKKAAHDFIHFKSKYTMGRFSEIGTKGGTFKFLDYSYGASLPSFTSSLKLLKNIHPKKHSKKIAVVGRSVVLAWDNVQTEMAKLIDNVDIDELYLVGKFDKSIMNNVKNINIKYADTWQEIENEVINKIGDGDVIYIQGYRTRRGGITLWPIANTIYKMGNVRFIIGEAIEPSNKQK